MPPDFCLTPSLSRYIGLFLNTRVRLWDPGPEAFQNAQRIRLRQYVYFLRYWLERRCQPLWCAWKSFPRVASILLSWSSPAKSVLQIASKSFFCKSARINYWLICIGNWLNSLILPLARWFWEFFCKSTWVACILLSWSSSAKSVLQIASKSFFFESARNNYRFIYLRNWLNSLILPLARWFWEFFCKSTWVARILLSWSSSAKSVLHIASKSTKIKKIPLARWFWALFRMLFILL